MSSARIGFRPSTPPELPPTSQRCFRIYIVFVIYYVFANGKVPAACALPASLVMDLRQEILDIPRALEETLEKGRAEFEALVRATRWGDGPITMVGSGASFFAALTGAYAFEGLLGWPVVAYPAMVFHSYALSILRPRSVFLAISRSGESGATLEAARAARSRGAVVLALTHNPSSPLAETADGVFLLRVGEESSVGIKTAICQQAAIGYISLVAARVLKRHHPLLDTLDAEFRKLPGQIEWVFAQLPDAVRAFTQQLRGFGRLDVVGGGFYHPTALEWAQALRGLSALDAEAHEWAEFRESFSENPNREVALVILSSSRCRLRKDIHQAAGRMKRAGAKILSVTDTNDRELANDSMFAVLLPVLSEIVGATLTLALLDLVASQIAREQGRDPGWSGPDAKSDLKRGKEAG